MAGRGRALVGCQLVCIQFNWEVCLYVDLRLVIMILCDADAVFSATGSKREVSPEKKTKKAQDEERTSKKSIQ